MTREELIQALNRLKVQTGSLACLWSEERWRLRQRLQSFS